MNKQVQAALEISDEKYKDRYSGENLIKAADDLRQREKVKKLMEGYQGGGFKP